MLVVNLATRGPQDAAYFVEYCNHPGGTTLSELRRTHGWDKPHGVKFWCLGNEMDGPWHTGAETPEEYGRVAARAAKIMRWADNSIEIAASGSSGRDLPSFGSWDETVLKHAFDHVDHIAIHTYLNNWKDDGLAFLATPDFVDAFIEEVVAIADAAAAKRRSAKRIMLSFNEWNVWYRTRRPYQTRMQPGWPIAPPILEEVYSVEDALVVGGFLISLLNHADRVRSACLAQLVNVIAPDHDRDGRSSVAPDDLLSFRADELLRARRRAEGVGRVRNLRGGVLLSARCERRFLPRATSGVPQALRRCE